MMMIIITLYFLYITKNQDGSRSYLKIAGFTSLAMYLFVMLVEFIPSARMLGEIIIFSMDFSDIYLCLGVFYALYGFLVSAIDKCYSLPRILISPTFWAGTILFPVFWLDLSDVYYGFLEIGYTVGFICLILSVTKFFITNFGKYGAIFIVLSAVTLLLKMGEGNFPWYEAIFGQMFGVSLVVLIMYSVIAFAFGLKREIS